MNGFGAAYPEVQYRKKLAKIIRLGDFTFDYKHKDGRILTAQLPTVKAHNLILDTILSVGLLGLIPYLTLLGLCLVQIINSPYRGIEAVAIAYFAYTFTWFECAQFSHIARWALSFFSMDQIVTATGISPTINGFALEVGEQETHRGWEQFKQSVLSRVSLNLNKISDGIVEYQGVGGKVKLQYQDKDLPKVWRNGQFHDWRHHYRVYQNAAATKTPIYQGWKEGKLIVEAGGYQFQTRP